MQFAFLFWLSNIPKLQIVQIVLSPHAEKNDPNLKKKKLFYCIFFELWYLHSNRLSLFLMDLVASVSFISASVQCHVFDVLLNLSVYWQN